MKQNITAPIWKGLFIGATMIVPGVSGGTMAMILGIYDRLISAVSSFRKNPRDNFLFLTLFAVSAAVGLFLFSTPLSWLLENYEVPTLYFFIGAVAGGIPFIEKKSRIRKVDAGTILYLILGAVIVILISKLPGDFAGAVQSQGVLRWLLLGAAGIVSAVALILPGISFSHFLLVLGLYEQLLNAVKTLDLKFLLPLVLGVLLGIILFSKLLECVLENYSKVSYLLILGFIIGSVAMIFPGLPKNWEVIASMITAVAGFFAVYRNTSV